MPGREAIESLLALQMGTRTRVSPDQGDLGLSRESHRRALRVRMAGPARQLVSLICERELVSRTRLYLRWVSYTPRAAGRSRSWAPRPVRFSSIRTGRRRIPGN